MFELDLVDEMLWEDCDKVEWLSLEDAGLEEVQQVGVCAALYEYWSDEGGW